MQNGFIKLMRSRNTLVLLQRPKCFVLLSLIALRARRTGEINMHNLGIGEALIGDREAIGLTQQEYRTAKSALEKLGLVTFRGTNKGTVAKLIDTSIFDVNVEHDNEQNNDPATIKERTGNEQATTNKNDKELKNEKRIKNKYKNFKKNFLNKSEMPPINYEDMLEAGIPSRHIIPNI